jgi:Holliday junction resolvasome RuvABC endonuclease subunit
MLPYPLDKNAQACIVGIDPGSETLGVCILYFNVVTIQVTEIITNTYIGSKLPISPMLSLMHGDRVSRIAAHQLNLINIYRQHNPVAVVSEAPFYNPRRPNAFGALVEVICAIRNSVINYSDTMCLYQIDPASVKRAIGAKGNADKDVVKQHIGLIPEIVNNLKIPLNLLDEHSIDATAVAYHHLLSYRNNQLNFI